MNKHILFVHIPKTAGTSFRVSAQNFFGENNTFYDYGSSELATSEDIMKYVYEQNDMYKLGLKFKKYNKLFLCGHFSVSKYMPFFDTLNVITFFRNPIAQVLSHYKHFTRHYGYKKDIVTFIKDKNFKNRQSKALSGKPIGLFGFIGLTEEYSKSIELINYYYGLDIETISINEDPDKILISSTLDIDIVELIKKENSRDMEMYENIKKIFNKRVECYNENKIYTHIHIQEQTKSSIRGVAFKNSSNEAPSIDLMDGEKKINVKATLFRPGMLIHKLPRDGFVGFEYSSKDLNKVELIV